MQINAISFISNHLNNNNLQVNNNNRKSNLQYRYNLQSDTVSFGEGEKKGRPMSEAVTHDLATDVVEEVRAAARRVHNTLKQYMKPLIATNSEPNNPICGGEKGVSGRIKKEYSLRQKTAKRKIINREEILKMGDLLGHRIILRDASQKNVAKVLAQLAKAVKQGNLNIIEIESYVGPDGRTYATPAMLDQLAAVCNKNKLKKRYDQELPSGYPAIHIGFKTREGYIGEIQIMGQDVEELKDYDDIVYKLMDDNDLDPKYKPIQRKLKPILDGLTQEQEDAYVKYRRDSFAYAFDQKPRQHNSRKKTPRIPIPYFLPKELGYDSIAELKYKCDAEYKKKEDAKKAEERKRMYEESKHYGSRDISVKPKNKTKKP